MSFDNTTPEPKKFYLDLLIQLTFDVSMALYRFKNWSDAINGMAQILAMIYAEKEAELKPTAELINDAYKNGSTIESAETELPKAFKTIQNFLNQHWFSELHLGIIPTSTMQTEQKKPTHTALNPNQSSRL